MVQEQQLSSGGAILRSGKWKTFKWFRNRRGTLTGKESFDKCSEKRHFQTTMRWERGLAEREGRGGGWREHCGLVSSIRLAGSFISSPTLLLYFEDVFWLALRDMHAKINVCRTLNCDFVGRWIVILCKYFCNVYSNVCCIPFTFSRQMSKLNFWLQICNIQFFVSNVFCNKYNL